MLPATLRSNGLSKFEHLSSFYPTSLLKTGIKMGWPRTMEISSYCKNVLLKLLTVAASSLILVNTPLPNRTPEPVAD